MKRDMDYIRQLLVHIEEADSLPEAANDTDDDRLLLTFHLLLLLEAGFVAGFEILDERNSSAIKPMSRIRLTWAGHEFLDAARDDTIWQKAKSRVGAAVGTTSVAVLTQVLIFLAKEKLGLNQ